MVPYKGSSYITACMVRLTSAIIRSIQFPYLCTDMHDPVVFCTDYET